MKEIEWEDENDNKSRSFPDLCQVIGKWDVRDLTFLEANSMRGLRDLTLLGVSFMEGGVPLPVSPFPTLYSL